MARCTYIWHASHFEGARAVFEAERAAEMREKHGEEWATEQDRRHALMEGQQCVEDHPVPDDICKLPDCRHLDEWAPHGHHFIVGDEHFVTSSGIGCWFCERDGVCPRSWSGTRQA